MFQSNNIRVIRNSGLRGQRGRGISSRGKLKLITTLFIPPNRCENPSDLSKPKTSSSFSDSETSSSKTNQAIVKSAKMMICNAKNVSSDKAVLTTDKTVVIDDESFPMNAGLVISDKPFIVSDHHKREEDDWMVFILFPGVAEEEEEKENDKASVIEYLTNVTEYKLDESLVDLIYIEEDEEEMCLVSIKISNDFQIGNGFLDAVKKVGHASSLEKQFKRTLMHPPPGTGSPLDAETPLLLKTENNNIPEKSLIKKLCELLPSTKVIITFVDVDHDQRQHIDKTVIREYVREITGVRLSEESLQPDRTYMDRCSFIANCYSKDKAEVLARRINEVSAETSMNAVVLEGDDLEIHNVWETMFEKVTKQFELHHSKISDISKELDQIDAEKKRGRGRYVPLDMFDSRLARREPLDSKKKELQLQETEFAGCIDEIQGRLHSLKGNKKFLEDLDRLTTEFEVELKRFRSALPMYARRTTIIETVRNHQVSIILGETGSGKSTQILQYLHDAGLTESGLIVCTQPRKVAAVTLASRVAEEMNCEAGELVGYQVGMKSKRSQSTRILYVTDHILLNDSLKDPTFSKYSCVVIDEAHERSIYTDLLLGFIKRSLPKRPDLRVIITSATIDPEVFIKYFDDTPPVVRVSGRAFPVEVFYEAYAEDDYIEAAVRKAIEVHRTEKIDGGDVLVFLTSPLETEKACKILRSRCREDEVLALEINGRLQLEQQQLAFHPTPSGKRKIVFATNSAETSVTIPGIKYVIDTGKVREMSYDGKRNMSILSLQWTSKSSADQRKGRAGRTDSGKCYRMYTMETFEEMKPNSVPEILRIHLGQALLKLLMLGISDPMEFEFVQSPQRVAILNALAVLRELEAYDDVEGITEVGKQLAKISLEPRLGKVALMGIEEGIGYDALVLTAVSSAGGSVFFRSGSEDEKRSADKKKTKFCSDWGDMITCALVFKAWNNIPEKGRGRWCVENSINGKTMKIAKDSLKEIMQTFRQDLGKTIEERFSDDPDLHEKLAKILLVCYPSNLSRFLGHEKVGYCLATDPSMALQLHPSSSLLYMEESPQWLVYEQVLETSNRFMLNATRVEESWIEEKMSSLKIDRVKLQREIVCPFRINGIGKFCIGKLLENKAQGLKDLEAKIRQELTDISSREPKFMLDLNSQRGTVVICSSENVKEMAKDKVVSYLDTQRNSLRKEAIETSIRKGSTVRIVLGKGLQIQSVLMPGERRQVAVTLGYGRTSDPNEIDYICENLKIYGEIESCTLAPPKSSISVFVTFKNENSVTLALDSDVLPFTIKVVDNNELIPGPKFHSDFSVKVVTSRRPLLGHGYIEFKNYTDALSAIVEMDSSPAIVTKVIGQGRLVQAEIHLSSSKRPFQAAISGVPDWADQWIIKSALRDVLLTDVHQSITNVVLLRTKSPTDSESRQLCRDFRVRIIEQLLRSDALAAQDYQIQVNEPRNEKDFTMVAYLKFKDLDKAAEAANLVDGSPFDSDLEMEARLDMKASFIVGAYQYDCSIGDIRAEIDNLKSETEGHVSLKIDKRQNGSFFIQVETSELTHLKESKQRLNDIIYGHKFDVDAGKYMRMKTEDGNKRKYEIQKKARVRIRLDERQKNLFIHGQKDHIIHAKSLLEEYLNSKGKEVICKDVNLKENGCPRGTMKALVLNYGANLEKLKETTSASVLDLILKRHTIRFQGSVESYEKLKKIIETMVQLLSPGSRFESEPLPECSLCLTNIEDYDSCYTLECCSHLYCTDCASNLVKNGLATNNIPIRCVVDGCEEDLAIRDIQNLLSSRLEQTYDPAIRSFIATCNNEFAYCTTPDCPMIYRKHKKIANEFACTECKASICVKCDEAHHPGMTCETYSNFFVKGDTVIKAWLKADPAGRSLCSKCGVGIEKNGGCMHMECTKCKAHICWHCKKHFMTSQDCYKHLQEKHGGYM